MGTAGTRTRCHFDSYHNILAQVVGYKFCILFPPEVGKGLYPVTGDDAKDSCAQGNISMIDVEEEEEEREGGANPRFPLYPGRKASWMGVLGPGDCLFIPQGWWHYIRAITTSISVNFWWEEEGVKEGGGGREARGS